MVRMRLMVLAGASTGASPPTDVSSKKNPSVAYPFRPPAPALSGNRRRATVPDPSDTARTRQTFHVERPRPPTTPRPRCSTWNLRGQLPQSPASEPLWPSFRWGSFAAGPWRARPQVGRVPFQHVPGQASGLPPQLFGWIRHHALGGRTATGALGAGTPLSSACAPRGPW